MRQIDEIKDVQNAPARYVDATGDGMTGKLTVERNNDQINAKRGKNIAVMTTSATDGEYLFGGRSTSFNTDFIENYIRIGKNKLQYSYGQGMFDIYHKGNKPTLSELGAAASNHNHDNLYQPKESTSFSVQEAYIAVRTPTRKANQYYEFWDTNSGWADIKCRQLYAGDGKYMVYHPGNKPTPLELGAVNKNGDEFYGDLTFFKGYSPIKIKVDYKGGWARGIEYYKENKQVAAIGLFGIDNNEQYLYLGMNGRAYNGENSLLIKRDGCYFNNQKIYHPGNKPTPSEIGAASADHNHSKIKIDDVRGTNPTPDDYVSSYISTFFTDTYGDGWRSGITVKGWSNSYAVWQISNPSSTSAVEGLNFRVGAGNSWGPWRKIYHEGHKPSPGEIGALGRGEKAASASIADAVEWGNVRNRPGSLPPSSPHSFSVSGENDTGTNRSSDLNTVWKSGFYEISSGRNKPDGTDWHWVIHAGHTSNRSDYRYGMQISAGNNTNNFYIRTTNQSGNGEWGKIYTTKNKPTPDEIGAVPKNGSSAIKIQADSNYSSDENSITIAAGKNELIIQSSMGQKLDDTIHFNGKKVMIEPEKKPLWEGCTYLNKGMNFKVSKPISQCQNGWVLVFSDYDPGGDPNGNNYNFCTHVVHKNSLVVNNGNVLFSIPNNETNGWTIKAAYIKDNEIQGQSIEGIAGWNDVVLRQILEF